MEPEKKKKFALWKKILLVILILLLIGITVVSVILAKIFDPQPITVNQQPLTMADSLTAGRFIMRDIPRALRNPVKGKTKEIVLREREVNSILKFLLVQMQMQNAQGPFDPARTEVTLKEGVFTARSVLYFPKMALFGNYINIVIRFRVSYADGKETVSILSAKAGSWNIPEKDILRTLENARNTYMKDSRPEKILRRSLRTVGTDVRGLSIVFEPYEVVDGIDREYYGGRGIFRRTVEQMQ